MPLSMPLSTPLQSAALLAIVLVVAGCAGTEEINEPAPVGDPLAPLSWLAGAWIDPDPQGAAMEEHWTVPGGATMFGVNRTIRGGSTIAFEFLRIEARDDDTIVYIAQPQGRFPGTEFPLIEIAGTRAVFANPAHDFPKKLTYSLAEGILTVDVEGVRAGQTTGFTQRWQRVR
jgi:hypothetical protein